MVIRGHLCSSVVIRGHSWSFVVTRGHSWSFVVTRGHSWSLVVIRGHSCVLLDKIESDQELDINVITYADVVKKGKDISQYQVQNEDVALEIALKRSMANVCNLFAINSYKIPNFSVRRKLN